MMNEIPNPLLGVRFHPTDEELIRYLIKFVCTKNYFCDDIEIEDLYGSKKPWELLEDLSEVKYFFTQLKKKKSDHSNKIRKLTGGGKWRSLDKGKRVGPKCVGIKKTYRYVDNQVVHNASWIMREYSLDEKVISLLRKQVLIKHEDFVLRLIKVKQSGDHVPKDADVVTDPMISSMATEPQWPIYSDESGHGCQQIVMCPTVNEGHSNAGLVQNMESGYGLSTSSADGHSNELFYI